MRFCFEFLTVFDETLLDCVFVVECSSSRERGCMCVCVCVKAVKCMPDLFRSDSNNVTKYEHEREGEGERS